MASVPLHLVNGFLGSGKTTFLMHYLDTFSHFRKIAVIQNEFSSSGMDGHVIRRHQGTYKLLEINNGSVFCVCLLGSFTGSLAAFIEENQPDEIIMEASGMSDPVSIGQVFSAPELRDKVYLGLSWTLVDALNFFRITSLRPRIDHQIRISDIVIINKTDLAGDSTEQIIKTVKEINPFASLLPAEYAQVNLSDTAKKMKFYPSSKNENSYRPDLQSVVIKSPLKITREKLEEFITDVGENFIRIKGFVNLAQNQKIAVQGIFDQYSYSVVDWFSGITELVGIGHFNDPADFTVRFEKYCTR